MNLYVLVLDRNRSTRPKNSSFAVFLPPHLWFCAAQGSFSRWVVVNITLLVCFRRPLFKWLTLAEILILFVCIKFYLKASLYMRFSFSLGNGRPILISHKATHLMLMSTCPKCNSSEKELNGLTSAYPQIRTFIMENTWRNLPELSRLLLPGIQWYLNEQMLVGWNGNRFHFWQQNVLLFLHLLLLTSLSSSLLFSPFFVFYFSLPKYLPAFLFSRGCLPHGMCNFWRMKPTDISQGLPEWHRTLAAGDSLSLSDKPEHSDFIWQAASVIWRHSQGAFCLS